jgi:proliferating cell nuclear antigen
MFKAKICSKTIKEFVGTLELLTTEFKMKATKKGIETTAVDGEKVGMICMKLDAKGFIEYEADDAEFGINIDRLNPILKLSTSEDVELNYDPESNRMVITIGNLKRTMALLSIDEMKDVRVPHPELPALITLNNTAELMKGMRAADDVSDHLKLTASKDGLLLTAEGDTDDVELKIAKEDIDSLTADKSYHSMYTIDKLRSIMNRASGAVTIGLGADSPIRLIFDIAGGNGTCTFMMAPRVEYQ